MTAGPGHDILACLPLVEGIVGRLARRLPSHLSRRDLVSAGVVGLMEAARRFDPAHGTRFEAFARARIQGAVLDELRRADLMARDARREAKRLAEAVRVFLSEHHRLPTDAEVAARVHLTEAEYREKLETLLPVRLKSFDPQAERSHGLEAATPSPLAQAERRQLAERLAWAIEKLHPRQQQVLHLYYRKECTLKEIGTILRVSESRVSQLMSAAQVALRGLILAGNPRRSRPGVGARPRRAGDGTGPEPAHG